MLSKALVVGAYQKKAEELAALPGVDLTVAVPPVWREPGVGDQALERRFVRGYRLVALPIWLNGRHHVHFYPAIERLVAQVRPDVFHIDEESFNFATYQAMRAGVRYGARCCFYNWATVDRRYPPPFGWFEQYAFRHAAHANAMARRLAEGMPFPIAHPVEANAVFVEMDEPALQRLQAAGWQVYRFLDGAVRFVCSWATTAEAVDALSETLRDLA